MARYSLRGRVIERWEKEGNKRWNCEKTEYVCLEEDRKLAEEGYNPARKFRKFVELEDKENIRRWVLGSRFPWLNPGKTKKSKKIDDNTLNQNGPFNKSIQKGYDEERKVRKRLEGKFGMALPERAICVGHRSTGEEINHKFDLVSEDRTIIGEVKSYKHTKKAHANTRLPRIILACKYLELAEAEKKMLVLTDKQIYEVMKHDLDGLIDSNIEIIYMDLNG